MTHSADYYYAIIQVGTHDALYVGDNKQELDDLLKTLDKETYEVVPLSEVFDRYYHVGFMDSNWEHTD